MQHTLGAKTSFSKLEIGKVFWFDNALFVKINMGNYNNSFCIMGQSKLGGSKGELCYFQGDVKVLVVEYK